ncbi:hypothetical protein ACQJBY_051734 [Aegilops geniculata]
MASWAFSNGRGARVFQPSPEASRRVPSAAAAYSLLLLPQDEPTDFSSYNNEKRKRKKRRKPTPPPLSTRFFLAAQEERALIRNEPAHRGTQTSPARRLRSLGLRRFPRARRRSCSGRLARPPPLRHGHAAGSWAVGSCRCDGKQIHDSGMAGLSNPGGDATCA